MAAVETWAIFCRVGLELATEAPALFLEQLPGILDRFSAPMVLLRRTTPWRLEPCACSFDISSVAVLLMFGSLSLLFDANPYLCFHGSREHVMIRIAGCPRCAPWAKGGWRRYGGFSRTRTRAIGFSLRACHLQDKLTTCLWNTEHLTGPKSTASLRGGIQQCHGQSAIRGSKAR